MSSVSESPPRSILHVLTTANDRLAPNVLAQPGMDSHCTVIEFDLRTPAPDYDALLDAVFAADAIAVW